jgi:hypothetical protein
MFAIGMAAFFEHFRSRPVTRRIVSVVVVLAILLNIFQMLQYWNHVLPFSDTTWDQYRRVFLRWQ